jgi:hypothetical protein
MTPAEKSITEIKEISENCWKLVKEIDNKINEVKMSAGIILNHTNKIKNQNVKLQKTQSALFIIPRVWFDNNFNKEGQVAIHRVTIDNCDCLIIKKLEAEK